MTADVIVIGGGFIGVSTAYYLSRRGVGVIIEQGDPQQVIGLGREPFPAPSVPLPDTVVRFAS